MNIDIDNLIKQIEENLCPEEKEIESLGLTLKDGGGTFKSWAPLAQDVKLRLFKKVPKEACQKADAVFNMEKLNEEKSGEWKGIWTYTLKSLKDFSYYQYEITNFGKTYNVPDIWAFASSGDSLSSQIADINQAEFCPERWEKEYYNPWASNDCKNNSPDQKNYSQAVIYEMHLRDWAKALNSSIKGNSGSYLEVTKALEEDSFLNRHLKSLSISHVQLLPVFDYAQTNSDDSYNWGYNPYNYNVPEGRYCVQAKEKASSLEGENPIKELRALIKAFHLAGIAVNMDVVYNHTNGTGQGSIYDMTVPYYFYRFNKDGSYSNGSGCGNEIASGRKMVKAFIIRSLKHWMDDFHVNGFRFDLMGCMEASTASQIYSQLSKKDKNVMVYGEPWTGGPSMVCNGANITNGGSIKDCQPSDLKENASGIGCFDNVFRDAIKGAEFGGFEQGHVQGNFADQEIIQGLTGSKDKVSRIGQYINYVECHDNYTLFDKIAISSLNKKSFSGDLYKECSSQLEEIKAQDCLAASYVILAQGTPFINGGQEFMRSKRGDCNSYISSDQVNAIDLQLCSKNKDVLDTYKGLLAFRKKFSEFFGSNSQAQALCIIPGITKYTSGPFTIIFNASDQDYKYLSQKDFCRFNISDINIKKGDKIFREYLVKRKSFEVFCY